MTVSVVGNAGIAGAALAPSLVSATPNLSASNLALTTDAVSPSASVSQPGVEVTLGNVPSADIVYAKLAVAANKTAWTTPPTGDLGQLMESNLKAHVQAGDFSSLLSGLGSQLLSTFSTTQRDFQQTAVVYRPSYSSAIDGGAAAATDALQAAKSIQNNISLKIYTASGKAIDIAITFGGNGGTVQDSLGIELHTSDALSIAEQVAISRLASGFDAALQGIGKDSTQVDISGLVGFDTKVLSSVDLNVQEAPQANALRSLALHVDASRRSFALQSHAGNVSVNVNLSSPAPLGSTAQQQSAVQHYLDQFDTANQRAHGDATLLGQFKDAFAQLHSSYPVAGQQFVGQQSSRALFASRLSTEDQAALSGLADFEAGMSGDFNNSATYGITTEAGHLNYQVSQSTQTHGADKNKGLSVAQTQVATLDSVFAKSRSGMLNTDIGNYDIYRINDNSSITTAFEYADDKLKSASVTNLVSQSEKYQKLENHKIVAERNTPHNTFTVEDISKKLQP